MLTLKEKFKLKEEYINTARSFARPLAVCLLSALFCNFRLGESFYPLVLVFSSVSPDILPFSLLGSSVGIFLFLMGRNSLRYLAALLLLGATRILFPDFLKNSRILTSAFSSSCLFVTSLPFLLSDFSYLSLLVYLSEALVCFSSSLIMQKCEEALTKSLPLTSSDLLAIGISSAFIYVSASSFKLLGLSIIKILFVAVVFALSLHFKPAYSLASGILLGICGSVNGDMLSALIFPAGALAACAFLPAGKILSASAFLFSAVFLTVLKGIDESFIYLFAEIALGLFIGFFLPKSLFAPLDILKEDTSGEILKNASAYRLLKTARALEHIGSITEKVSKEFEKLHGEPMEKHIKTAVDTACRNCKNSPTCWQRYYDRTTEEVHKLFTDGKNGLPLDMDAFRKATDCINCNRMEDCINEEAKKYADFLRTKASSQSIRFIMCDQFSGFSELLTSLKEEVSEIIPLDEKEGRACLDILKSAGCIEEGGFAGKNRDGNATLSFLFPPGAVQKISVKELTEALSETLRVQLSQPVREKEGNCTRLFWHTEPPFSVEFDYFQRASENKRICGDSCETAVSLSGDPLFFLSDGMGVGGDAAVDSTMTTCLLSHLISSGAAFPSALKLASASLLSIKDERLCTVDFLSPDLFKGTLTFYKAGAAPSYLLREGRCFKIGKSALPAGILGGAEAAKSVFSLKSSDLVLMVTDGITETGEDWLLSSLPPLCDLSPIEICKEVIELASKRSLTGRCDDMTAMVIKFTQNR